MNRNDTVAGEHRAVVVYPGVRERESSGCRGSGVAGMGRLAALRVPLLPPVGCGAGRLAALGTGGLPRGKTEKRCERGWVVGAGREGRWCSAAAGVEGGGGWGETERRGVMNSPRYAGGVRRPW